MVLGEYHYHGFRDYEEARIAFERACQLAPGTDISFELSTLLRRQGRWEESVDLMSRALEFNPRGADIHMNLGVSYAMLRRFDLARAASDRALELDPEFPMAAWFSATSRMEMEGLEAGRAYLDDFLTETSPDPDWVLWGTWLDQLAGDHERALDRLGTIRTGGASRIVAILPTGWLRARSLRALGREEEAAAALQESADSLEAQAAATPEDDRVWAALGLVYAYQGRDTPPSPPRNAPWSSCPWSEMRSTAPTTCGGGRSHTRTRAASKTRSMRSSTCSRSPAP